MVERYITISIPEKLIEEVDKIIKTGKLGYKSRAEFVKDSIRNQIKNIN
jgi:metal-responsive CopG/Arc/MetJ family transcriptional regulator